MGAECEHVTAVSTGCLPISSLLTATTRAHERRERASSVRRVCTFTGRRGPLPLLPPRLLRWQQRTGGLPACATGSAAC